MIRAVFALLLLASTCFGEPLTDSEIREAVVMVTVRVPESATVTALHRASAVAIKTDKERTLFASCAHEFTENTIKLPVELQGKRKTATGKVVKYMPDIDLALIEAEGTWPVTIPLADEDYKPGKGLLSVGYDGGKFELVIERATVFGQDDLFWFTKELMKPGRSGGGLIDTTNRCLIGIVSPGTEPSGGQVGLVWPTKRGLYVHLSLLREKL